MCLGGSTTSTGSVLCVKKNVREDGIERLDTRKQDEDTVWTNKVNYKLYHVLKITYVAHLFGVPPPPPPAPSLLETPPTVAAAAAAAAEEERSA